MMLTSRTVIYNVLTKRKLVTAKFSRSHKDIEVVIVDERFCGNDQLLHVDL